MPSDDKEPSLTEKPRGIISRNRIESLSDIVFGLSLSIGALTLIAQPPTTPSTLNSHVIAFVFSFVILIATWLQYTIIVSRLPVETGALIFANIILLLLIVLTSYLINNIQFPSPPLPIPVFTALGAYSSQLYALNLAGVVGILAFFAYILGREEKQLVPEGFFGKVRLARNLLIFFAILFLVSALPQFWSWRIDQVPLRLAAWWIPLIGTLCLDAWAFQKPRRKKLVD